MSIQNNFYKHGAEQRKLDVDTYKKHLVFVKFSKFMFEKLPWIVLAIVLIIATNIVGLFVVKPGSHPTKLDNVFW